MFGTATRVGTGGGPSRKSRTAVAAVAFVVLSIALSTFSSAAGDSAAPVTALVSRAGGEGHGGDGNSLSPSISGDGRYVAYSSRSPLAPDDVDAPNFPEDIFVRDRAASTTTLVSRASGTLGMPGDGPSFNPSISADGSYVAFDSRATNLSGSDRDRFSDVFRRQPVYAREQPLPKCTGRTATIIGTGGKDSLTGTKRSDVILGLGGGDRIRGLTGADTICSGPGRDVVDAGPNGGHGGADLVLGGPGADHLTLGPELGTLKGQAGNDVLVGSRGGDALYGGAGNDALFGGPGPDDLNGGPGHNRLIPR